MKRHTTVYPIDGDNQTKLHTFLLVQNRTVTLLSLKYLFHTRILVDVQIGFTLSLLAGARLAQDQLGQEMSARTGIPNPPQRPLRMPQA